MKSAALIVFAFFISTADAQVLTTAETLGKNHQAIFLAENHLFVDGVDLNIAYLQYLRGLTENFDLYISVGSTNITGQNQSWIGLGANYHLFRIEEFDVSAFDIFSTPLDHRAEASTVLLNSALVISRNMGKFTLYTGVNSLIPIGARSRGLFTPPSYEVNAPIGIFITWDTWGLFLEGDIGHLKAVGLGLAYSF